MSTCPFCKRLVSHFKANSHVIPEWMYKGSGTYDEKGRVIRYDLQNEKRHLAQQGYKGSFICDGCEEKTAELDSYASLIFKDKNFCAPGVNKEKRILDENTTTIAHVWSGFNFRKIQRFIYSICLRQHFYNLSKKIEGLIITKHLFPLFELYYSDQIDDNSYPIFIFYLDKHEIYKCVIPPHIDKISGHHVIIFIACGFKFLIKTSSHQNSFDYDMKDIRLQYPGAIYIPQINFEESGTVKKTFLKTKQIAHQIRGSSI